MTEKVYEELDDAKAEIEKLRSEYHVKADLCDNLKRSYYDQVKRIQELNLKLEKQAQEVEAKADEVYAANQSLEDLEGKLKEKECIIKSFTSANDKLRVDFNLKLQESEDDKRKLVSLLEEANAKILDLEHENRAFMDKIEVLKEGILSVSQKKCANESKMAKASKQMRERGDMFETLKEEKVKLEEQLKWKNERFKHLEEAHEKLRDKLRSNEKEWDMEKRSFFDEISTLETKLDSHMRLSEDLKRRLETRNQALAYEENQRMCLDKDVETLRNLLGEKDCVFKEMEYNIAKLEEENQELVISLNELKESHIREASNSSSVDKLRKKLKTLEHVYNDCSSQNKIKEAEWSSRFEKVVADLKSFRLELESKEACLKEMTTELDDYNSLVLQLTMEKEESAVMMVAMKSTLLEARSKTDEEKVLFLKNELESTNCDLVKARAETESLKMLEEQKLLLHKDIESREEQLLDTKSELKNVCDLLDKANEELAQSCCEVNEVEFELQIWKSIVGQLEANLEQNHRMRKEVEASLLAQVAIEVNLKQENGSLVNELEENKRRIKDLEQKLKESKQNTLLQFEKDIDWWEKEWVAKELEAAILAQLESERIHEYEKQSLNKLVEEKDQRINNLQKIMKSLEEEFDDSTASFSSQLTKMQTKMNLFHEAWENMRTTVVLKEIEVQEKGLMIIELQKDLKKLASEKEQLMGIILGVSERVNKLSREDGQMMGTLRSIMLSFDGGEGRMELKDHFDPMKENTNVYQYQYQSPKRNAEEGSSVDERSPLRALNV